MHLLVWFLGFSFNYINPALIGGWLGGYGRVTTSTSTFIVGCVIWAAGFYGNLYHEAILRSIRAKSDHIAEKDKTTQDKIDKTSHDIKIVDGRVYMIPRGGLFEYILFPHVWVFFILFFKLNLSAMTLILRRSSISANGSNGLDLL